MPGVPASEHNAIVTPPCSWPTTPSKRAVFIVLMEGFQGGLDPEVPQQFACGARVLCKDKMRLLKHLQRPWRHVAQIAHRGRHHKQRSATHETKVRMMRLAKASFKGSTSGASGAHRDS